MLSFPATSPDKLPEYDILNPVFPFGCQQGSVVVLPVHDMVIRIGTDNETLVISIEPTDNHRQGGAGTEGILR